MELSRLCRLCQSELKRRNSHKTFNIIVKRLCSYDSTWHNTAEEKAKVPYMRRKLGEILQWYEQITGMDEVRMMQNRVIETQDKFIACQEKRRAASKELVRIQNRLKEIYSELETTNRGEERYLHLVTQEHVLLKDEKRLAMEFSLREKEERDSFSVLSTYVKESHEKERAQADRTKYWSIIGSIVGTIIGIVGSSINNEFKMMELRVLVKEAGQLHQDSKTNDPKTSALLTKHEETLSTLVTDLKNLVNSYSEHKDVVLDPAVLGRLDRLYESVTNNNEHIHNNNDMAQTVFTLNKNMQDVKTLLNSAQRYDGQLLAIPIDLETVLERQKTETRIILISVSVVSIIIPILLSYMQRV